MTRNKEECSHPVLEHQRDEEDTNTRAYVICCVCGKDITEEYTDGRWV